jgi:hypothetical protein
MWDAVEVVSFVWTVIILMYTVIAVALIIGRWAFNRIRQALHEGALLRGTSLINRTRDSQKTWLRCSVFEAPGWQRRTVFGRVILLILRRRNRCNLGSPRRVCIARRGRTRSAIQIVLNCVNAGY